MFHFDTIGCTTITGECSECLETQPKTTKNVISISSRNKEQMKSGIMHIQNATFLKHDVMQSA